MSDEREAAPPIPAALLVAIVACFFLSGAASLVPEVVWSRLLRLVFGTTTLAISTILVGFALSGRAAPARPKSTAAAGG